MSYSRRYNSINEAGSFLEAIGLAIKAARLEAVVIGNTASMLNGVPIGTEDVDILVRNTQLNREKVIKIAKLLGGFSEELSDMMDGRRVVLPDLPLDILFGKMGGGLRFESVRARSHTVQVGNASFHVASLEDVIKSKRATGRPKDIAALPMLEAALATRTAMFRTTSSPPREKDFTRRRKKS